MSYTIGSKVYEDLFTLGKEMYLNSDQFASELRKEPLLAFVQEQDENKYNRLRKLSHQSLPDDVFVYKASFLLNPFMSIRIKGKRFTTYEDLGKAMLITSPNPDPVLLELVHYQLITAQMRDTFFDSEHKEIYDKVRAYELTAEENLFYSYFAIAYYLSKKTTIIYQGVEYQDIFNLCYFLCKKEKDLDTLGQSFATSPLLKAYMEFNKDGTDIETYLHLCKETDRNQELLDQFLEERKHPKHLS